MCYSSDLKVGRMYGGMNYNFVELLNFDFIIFSFFCYTLNSDKAGLIRVWPAMLSDKYKRRNYCGMELRALIECKVS